MSLKKIGEVRDLFDPDHGDLLGVAGEAVHHGGALLAAGHGLAPASGHSSLDLIGDIVNKCQHGHYGGNCTYTGAPVLQEPHVILVSDLKNSLDMFPDEGPQHGPASVWRLCAVLRAAEWRLWSHGERMGGWWRPGLGPPLYCLHPPSQPDTGSWCRCSSGALHHAVWPFCMQMIAN